MNLRFLFPVMILLLIGCQDNNSSLDDLNSIKKQFLNSILEENFDQGPFHTTYSLRTVFLSKHLISVFGEIFVYDHLPHGWSRYESKNFYKVDGKFRELTLDTLFTTREQKEFLKSYCEKILKKEPCSYFFGKDPLYTQLDQKYIQDFVVDDRFLIIVFQPYSVGGCSDGPIHVKIPYEDLEGKWNAANSLLSSLQRSLPSREFISAWNEEF